MKDRRGQQPMWYVFARGVLCFAVILQPFISACMLPLSSKRHIYDVSRACPDMVLAPVSTIPHVNHIFEDSYMWPFTSNGSSKPTSDLEKELPDGLKGIFKQENPDNKHEALRQNSHQQRQVDAVVARSLKENPYNYEFDDYKRNENVKKATYINCAQLQKNVLTCLKNWKATDLLFCDREMKISAACTDVQTRALQRLHYDECVSIKQCQQIRFLVDDLFVKNFGENGGEFCEERCEGYFADVEGSFDKVWKA